MSVLALLFLRLALHKLPEREMGPTAWLALGPIGTRLGLLLLGENARDLFADGPLAGAGATAFGFGILGGLILWGYGLRGGSGLAVPQDQALPARRPALQPVLVGLAFPLAVYGLATLALGRLTEVRAFDVAGTLIAAIAPGSSGQWWRRGPWQASGAASSSSRPAARRPRRRTARPLPARPCRPDPKGRRRSRPNIPRKAAPSGTAGPAKIALSAWRPRGAPP